MRSEGKESRRLAARSGEGLAATESPEEIDLGPMQPWVFSSCSFVYIFKRKTN
jgi:hypothetical protein